MQSLHECRICSEVISTTSPINEADRWLVEADAVADVAGTYLISG